MIKISRVLRYLVVGIAMGLFCGGVVAASVDSQDGMDGGAVAAQVGMLQVGMAQESKAGGAVAALESGGGGAVALAGSWRGELAVGPSRLPLVFNFSAEDSGENLAKVSGEVSAEYLAEDSEENLAKVSGEVSGEDSGKLKATLESPLQNSGEIPLEVLFCSADSISLECKALQATYQARVTPGKIDGTFVQRVYRFALTLTPEKPLSERRPQTPKAPFPYMETDTVFQSSDGVALAGTLTLPEGFRKGECPVVVMVTGSGPQNRDEEIFEHRPFAVIADYLARRGVASFRYDDRGTAWSGGNYAEATVDTFKEDARSALRFVRESGMFGKAGVIGHSEGGTLALLIAPSEKPDFIISLAGMAIPAKATLMSQNIRSLDKSGITGAQKEASAKLIESIFDRIIAQHSSGTVEEIDVAEICRELSLDVPPIVLESVKRSNAARNGYFDSMVSLDPTAAMRATTCPVLALNGSKDTQVESGPNLESFRANVKGVEAVELPGLNHLMQHAETGETDEYAQISETISPDVLAMIADFIAGLNGK